MADKLPLVVDREPKTGKAGKDKARAICEDALHELRNPYSPITVVGERHTGMLQIAVHARSGGATRETCEAEMRTWYEAQDKTLITSAPEEVEKDLAKILDWVCSDRFVVRHERREEIRADELLLTLLPTTRIRRKILLLILSMCNVYGKCAMPYWRIANVLGCSLKSATLNVKSLLDDGFIRRTKGKTIYIDGNLIRDSNIYTVNREKLGELSELSEKQCQASAALPLGRMLEHMDDVYFGLLADCLPENVVKRHLAPMEKKNFQEFLFARKPSNINVSDKQAYGLEK